MTIEQWAVRWNISPMALRDLKEVFGINERTSPLNLPPSSEAAVQNVVRLEATAYGCRLWRNNVGAVYSERGEFIRYGLANDSPAVNKQIKSADLIGIRPVHITADMVGRTIGQFLSREIKHAGWSYAAKERERAQLRWAQLITAFGGDACFATGAGSL